MAMFIAVLLLGIIAVSALPQDLIIKKFDKNLRHQYVQGPDGQLQLVDMWMKSTDAQEAARYSPDIQNVYHLFTRENPQVSQPLLLEQEQLLTSSNFNSSRRTVVLIHGWQNSVISPFNSVVVRAFLDAADVNVVVVDWSAGASTSSYVSAVANTPVSGASVARFITWLNGVTGADLADYHVVGHGLGGHQAGAVGRALQRGVGYITALDPSFVGWVVNEDKLTPYDAVYTEVIHTNAGLEGYMATLGQIDFYPNGGVSMPGCISDQCDHDRSFHYFAESLVTGGFTGNRCATYVSAMAGTCILRGNEKLGGLIPKTGSTGIFYVRTNILPPFSRG